MCERKCAPVQPRRSIAQLSNRIKHSNQFQIQNLLKHLLRATISADDGHDHYTNRTRFPMKSTPPMSYTAHPFPAMPTSIKSGSSRSTAINPDARCSDERHRIIPLIRTIMTFDHGHIGIHFSAFLKQIIVVPMLLSIAGGIIRLSCLARKTSADLTHLRPADRQRF